MGEDLVPEELLPAELPLEEPGEDLRVVGMVLRELDSARYGATCHV